MNLEKKVLITCKEALIEKIERGTGDLSECTYALDKVSDAIENGGIRIKNGINKRRSDGKQVGLAKGSKITTQKSIVMKEEIKRLSKDFNGTNSDAEVMRLTGLARNTYYKYKREIKEEA